MNSFASPIQFVPGHFNYRDFVLVYFGLDDLKQVFFPFGVYLLFGPTISYDMMLSLTKELTLAKQRFIVMMQGYSYMTHALSLYKLFPAELNGLIVLRRSTQENWFCSLRNSRHIPEELSRVRTLEEDEDSEEEEHKIQQLVFVQDCFER